MKILFITRKYPPIVGGMERYAKELYESLSALAEVDLLANRLGNRALPVFLLKAILRIIKSGRRYDIIHFGDGLLAILIPLARAFTKSALTMTTYGLDVTYRNAFYQKIVVPMQNRVDRIICISRNTRELCCSKGMRSDLLTVIPCGIVIEAVPCQQVRLGGKYLEIENKRIILCTIGRLVKRKGHKWFIREVMPRLDASYIYLIAGDGPERPALEQAIIACGLQKRVFLLGLISEGEKEWLLGAARLFIMPNIPVSGDVEGFGLVLTEAATRGLMSVASDIDGIPDAVIPGETGILARPLDADSFVTAIESAQPDRDRVKAAVAVFDWKRIAARYISEMQKAHDIVTSDRSRRHRT